MVQIKIQLSSEHANGAAPQGGTEAAVSGPPQTHTHLLLQRLAPDKQDKAWIPTALMLIWLLQYHTSHTHTKHNTHIQYVNANPVSISFLLSLFANKKAIYILKYGKRQLKEHVKHTDNKKGNIYYEHCVEC